MQGVVAARVVVAVGVEVMAVANTPQDLRAEVVVKVVSQGVMVGGAMEEVDLGSEAGVVVEGGI